MGLWPLSAEEVDFLRQELQKHKQMLGKKSLVESDETNRHLFFDFNDNEILLQFAVDSHFMNCKKPLGLTYLNDEQEICQVLMKKTDFHWHVEHYSDEPSRVFSSLQDAVQDYLKD